MTLKRDTVPTNAFPGTIVKTNAAPLVWGAFIFVALLVAIAITLATAGPPDLTVGAVPP
jgi:hypothetical protein